MSIQWPLVLLGLFAGTGGSLLAFAGLAEFSAAKEKTRATAAVWGVALLIVGGLCSVLHLGHPLNFMAAIAHLGSLSGISVELIFLGLMVVCGAVYFIALRREKAQVAKVFGVIDIVLAVFLGFALGHGYMIEARANWNTWLIPLSFLFSGLLAGGALYQLIACVLEDGETGKVPQATAACAVLTLAAFAGYGAHVGLGEANVTAWWAAALVLGAIAPLVLTLVSLKRPSKTLLIALLVCAAIGAVAIRATMFAAGTGFITAFDVAVQMRALMPL